MRDELENTLPPEPLDPPLNSSVDLRVRNATDISSDRSAIKPSRQCNKNMSSSHCYEHDVSSRTSTTAVQGRKPFDFDLVLTSFNPHDLSGNSELAVHGEGRTMTVLNERGVF